MTIGYVYIGLTVLFTAFGQVLFKHRLAAYPPAPEQPFEKLVFLLSLLMDPVIILGFIAAFFAALSWMAALTKFELSYAYPFMSLSFVVVVLASVWFLGESISTYQILGLGLIVAGIIVGSKGLT